MSGRFRYQPRTTGGDAVAALLLVAGIAVLNLALVAAFVGTVVVTLRLLGVGV